MKPQKGQHEKTYGTTYYEPDLHESMGRIINKICTHQKAFVWLKTDLMEQIAEIRLTVAIPDI